MDITDTVQHLCKKYKTRNPYDLAEVLGINIYYMDLGSIRGYYLKRYRIKQIFLNNNLSEQLEKFVLSHEIGHSVLHPDANVPFMQTTFFSIEKFELQANKFAAELVIPQIDLLEYTIDQLAILYGLPREIIELRVKNRLEELT